MTWDFHVGQKVVCVDDSDQYKYPDLPGLVFITKGQVYQIRQILMNNDMPCLRLEGIERPVSFHSPEDGRILRTVPGTDVPFKASRFRPLVEDKKKDSAFTRLLKEIVSNPNRPVGLPNPFDKRPKVKEHQS